MPTVDHTDKLLDQLSAQYKLYRDEVRAYLNFAAGSASLFVALVVGEISVAKDNPRMLALIPLTTLSYGGILAMFYSYAVTAAHYSDLLERQLNDLLGTKVFLFESRYVGPKTGRGEFLWFAVIWCCVGIVPVALSGYAVVRLFQERLWHPGLVVLLLAVALIGLTAIIFAVVRIVKVRIALTSEIYTEWHQTQSTKAG